MSLQTCFKWECIHENDPRFEILIEYEDSKHSAKFCKYCIEEIKSFQTIKIISEVSLN